MTEMVTINAEITDTYCGEANYGWVKRVSFDVPANSTDRLAVRRAKQALGVSGLTHKKCGYGEGIELRFPGHNMIAFLSYHY